MLAVGSAVIVTLAVVLTAAQPADAATVYVTVYVPASLALGVIAPVVASMLKPDAEEYVPPVYAFVPTKVTLCADAVVQNAGAA